MAFDAFVIFSMFSLPVLSQGFYQQFTSPTQWAFYWSLVLGLMIIEVFLLWITRQYRVLTTNFGFVESVKMASIALIPLVVFYVVMYLIPKDYMPHFSFDTTIYTAICVEALIPSFRLAKRVIRIRKNARAKMNDVRTLMIGAGAGGKLVLDETRNNKSVHNRVVAIVDDDISKVGSVLSTVPIVGTTNDISKVVNKYKIKEIIIAIGNLSPNELNEIIKKAEPCNIKIKKLSSLSEPISGRKIGLVDVDIEELLSRKPVKLENRSINEFFKDTTVLVTGAGGSIGSELVKQIFEQNPKTIVLFDIYENGVYDVQQFLVREKRRLKKNIDIITLIGSTYNEKRLEQIFKTYLPELVFHAAAYKHVPLMEDSPMEAIRTNVIGTYNVAKLSLKYHVRKMILVSTDKAVRPTNVMGATKRFAEMIIQYFASKNAGTIFSAVRFGNVLGSNGSVVPLFKKQIEEGGPVTVTHKEMTRFFMTIPEAVSLILQSALYANKGEIFILDMGKPVRIVELAEKMIIQAGYVPYSEMPIVFIGLRPGEKLYEEILINVEEHKKTDNEKIYIENVGMIFPIEEEIVLLSKAFDLDNNNDIKKILESVVSTYHIPEVS